MDEEKLEEVIKACDELIEELKEEDISWRPKGWKNPYHDKTGRIPDENNAEFQDYEAGADAMLEGIKKGSKILGQTARNMLSTSVQWYDSVTDSKNGDWFFIPDEEERDADTAE